MALTIYKKDGYEYAVVPMEDQLKWAGVPERFRDVTWEKVSEMGLDPKLKWMEEWVPDEENYAIVLFGPRGRGKTTYAAATIRRFLHLKPMWRDWPRLVSSVADSWKHGGEGEVLMPTVLSPFLILDDFGKEVAGGADLTMASWQRRIAFEIINGRYNRMLPTIITTELDSDEMGDRLDMAITSRLMGDGQWVDLSKAPDYRLED